MTRRWLYPCDPECPEYASFANGVFGDEIAAMGGVIGEIMDDYERRHMKRCARCQAYGAANVDIE
jgi:hypothetical protein